MKGFVVPRGITTLAGGTAASDATTFTLKAVHGDAQDGIGENKYLAKNASTLSYEVTITLGEDTWSYDEVTMLRMRVRRAPLAHRPQHAAPRRVGPGRSGAFEDLLAP